MLLIPTQTREVSPGNQNGKKTLALLQTDTLCLLQNLAFLEVGDNLSITIMEIELLNFSKEEELVGHAGFLTLNGDLSSSSHGNMNLRLVVNFLRWICMVSWIF